MFKAIASFFSSRSSLAHSVTVAATALIGFYYSDALFHALVLEGIRALPVWARGIVGAIGVAALNYYNSQKSTESVQYKIKFPPVAPIILLIGLLAFPVAVNAQLPANLYAAGASYNSGASQPVAGNAMYAKLVSQSAGTYGFTMLDILPITTKPFTVSTNVSAGIAQKILNFQGVSFYAPTSAGISLTGSNTGWTWTSGILADYNIKKNGTATAFHVMPNVRWLKSSVSNGSDYQLIGGLMVGWGSN